MNCNKQEIEFPKSTTLLNFNFTHIFTISIDKFVDVGGQGKENVEKTVQLQTQNIFADLIRWVLTVTSQSLCPQLQRS